MIALTAAMLVLSVPAIAQDCDCTRVTGNCNASYTLQKRDDLAAGVHSAAQVLIRSSHPQCSKVGFYVDSTPYITVLQHTNQATESIFGTSKITQDTISIESCKICARSGAEHAPGSPPSTEAGQMFTDALANADQFDPQAAQRRFDENSDRTRRYQQIMGGLEGLRSIAAEIDARSSHPAGTSHTSNSPSGMGQGRYPREAASGGTGGASSVVIHGSQRCTNERGQPGACR